MGAMGDDDRGSRCVPCRRRGCAGAFAALSFAALVVALACLGARGDNSRASASSDGLDGGSGNSSSFMAVHWQQALRQSFTATNCPAGKRRWVLRLLTDDYPWETRWELHRIIDDDGQSELVASGPPEGINYQRRTRYVGALCLSRGEYLVRWFDAMGDGVCCAYGPGEWSARVDGELVLESSPADSFVEREYPFEVGGGEEVTGSFLIMPRLERPVNVELSDGTIYELQNLSPSFDYTDLVPGASLISLPAGTDFFANGIADVKGQAPRLAGRREKEGNAFEGTKSILVVRVDVSDGEMSVAETSLSDSVFGNGVDRVNMASQFEACSHGKLRLVKAPNRSGGSSDAKIANGVVTIDLPTIRKVDGHGTMRIAVTKELNAIFGVKHPRELADYVIYCLPVGTYSPNPGADGRGIAYAYIDNWLSLFNDRWCTSVSLQMHELGHNLNMGHSNEDGETYEDQTGIMGASYPNSESPRMCFNAAKSWQTGWYRDKGVTINSSGANQSFNGKLHGIADYPIATTVLLRIQNRSGNDHYVNFNAKRGINAGTQEARDLVTVVKRPRGGRDSYAESELVAKLDAGESFDILGYTISVGEIDAIAGTAEVVVSPK